MNRDRVRAAFSEVYAELKGERLTLADHVRLGDANFDSLDLLEAAVLVERKLRVHLEPAEFVAVNTFGELIDTMTRIAADAPGR